MNIISAQVYAESGVAYIVLPIPPAMGPGLMLHQDLSDLLDLLEEEQDVDLAQVAFVCGDDVLVLGFAEGAYQEMVENAELGRGQGNLLSLTSLAGHDLTYLRLQGRLVSGEHLFAVITEFLDHIAASGDLGDPPDLLAALRVTEAQVYAPDLPDGLLSTGMQA